MIYRAIEELSSELKPIDLYTVTERLKVKKELKKVGGASYLAQLTQKVGSAANVEFHAKIVAQKYVQRELIRSATEIQRRSYDESTDVTDLIGFAEQEIFKVAEGHVKHSVQSAADVLARTLAQIEENAKNKSAFNGVPSGFMALDRVTMGWQPSDLIIIAARPSMGKTSFLLNIIEHIALNEKKPTLLFSCEMPAVQIVERLLFARSGVRSREIIKRGNLTQLEMKHFKQAVKEVGASQLVIDDTAAISINELRAKARRVMRDQGGLAAIGVDYLQLMRSHSKQAANSREREVAEISAGLKALAKELKVPVIVLAQLNRGPESRTGASLGVPRISDLRESGSIEQDADMIGLLYRSAYYAEDEEKRQQMAGRANLHLAKNRNGPTGDVPLHFEAELMRFSTREADEHDQESE